MKYFILVHHPNPTQITGVTDFHRSKSVKLGEAPRCPKCGANIGALPLLPPIRIKIEARDKVCGDIAFGWGGNELLLSDRIWNFLQAEGLKGLEYIGTAEVIKVIRHRELSAPMPRYVCCRPTYGRAAVDDVASAIERDSPSKCSECRIGGIIKRAKRVVIEPGTWSGEDVFIARGLPGTIIVSERFKGFCDRNRVTGVLLVPAAEYSFDFYPEKAER